MMSSVVPPPIPFGRSLIIIDFPFSKQGDILANAIVSEAAIEYINGLLSDDSRIIRQNERFFRSEWYSVLTRLDPDVLMQMCRRHADELKAKGIRVYKVRKKWKQYEDS